MVIIRANFSGPTLGPTSGCRVQPWTVAQSATFTAFDLCFQMKIIITAVAIICVGVDCGQHLMDWPMSSIQSTDLEFLGDAARSRGLRDCRHERRFSNFSASLNPGSQISSNVTLELERSLVEFPRRKSRGPWGCHAKHR
jgi:hypothetical protein